MEIVIGSKNPIKIAALKNTLKDYRDLRNYEVIGLKTNSEVNEQPFSLEEIISGAINRSKNAFEIYGKEKAIYSFGIESGLFRVPMTKTGYMDICACSIYNGKDTSLGLSPGFELPIEVMKIIQECKIDAGKAFYEANLTDKKDLGSKEGAVGLLTWGRVDRKKQTKLAIQMALIQFEFKEFYSLS